MMAGLAGEHLKPLGRAANCGCQSLGPFQASEGDVTYALGIAGADVVRQAGDVVRVAHEDGGLDSRESVAGKS